MLTVIAGVTMMLTGVIGIPSLIIGIIAISRRTSDRASSARLTKIGWIVYAVNAVIGIVILVMLFAWAFAASSPPSGGF